VWGPEKARGRKGPHANVAPVAFRAALGDCLGSSTLRAAVFTHHTDATGTKGGFEGENTSIVASFDFHPLKTRELILGTSPHLEGAPPWQASVAVCLGYPWDPNGRRRGVRAIN
jgi:hypothetical protein